MRIIYEDSDLLAVDKPAGIVVFHETNTKKQDTKTLIELLVKEYPILTEIGNPPRYGVVHRLDKDTSGILLVAKRAEALIFLQKQFKNRGVEKKYIALVTGAMKEEQNRIHTLIGRSSQDPRKQKAYTIEFPISNSQFPTGLREAITEYKVLERFEDYTLLEMRIKTGRKHQIRCHLSFIHHPIAGDKLYGFKDSPTPKGLGRQFLHASSMKIMLPSGKVKEFKSELPEDLQEVLKNLKFTI